jgi:PiT family inorganic phosphate transporter
MLPAEAKGVADALLFDQLASLTSTTIRLPLRYAFVEPGEVNQVVNFDGRSYRLRVVAKRDTLSILEMECVLDDVGALQSATVTDGGYISVAEPVRVAPTVFQALDIPILRDADNDAGYYAAVAADRESAADQWDGAVFVQAFSADAFEQAFVTAESGIIGECLTTLGNWTGGNVFDESSTLDVEVVGELASSTRDLMLADLSINAMLVGHEIIRFRVATLLNTKASINTLFTLPLICSAALLSFAHGANDVANAVGPLAAIAAAAQSGAVGGSAPIPLWVMMVGAVGIALGLMMYGPRMIRKVGSEITELDQMRAYCIAMAATITVIIASQLGLPVSSTHIAVGGVFGVGFLREMIKASYNRKILEIEAHHQGEDRAVVEAFLQKFETAPVIEQGRMLEELKQRNKSNSPALLNKDERKQLKKIHQQQLVKRSILFKIAAAWLITVPASALLAATIFFTIRGIMLP